MTPTGFGCQLHFLITLVFFNIPIEVALLWLLYTLKNPQAENSITWNAGRIQSLTTMCLYYTI